MKRLIYVLFAVFLLASCSTLEIETRISRSFTRTKWERARIAVFPSLAAHMSSVRGRTADRVFARCLADKYEDKGPQMKSAGFVRRFVADNKLVTTFRKTLRRYQTLQIFDRRRLTRIGSRMNVDYLIFPVLVRDGEHSFDDGRVDINAEVEVVVYDVSRSRKVFSAITVGQTSASLLIRRTPVDAYRKAIAGALDKLF